MANVIVDKSDSLMRQQKVLSILNSAGISSAVSYGKSEYMVLVDSSEMIDAMMAMAREKAKAKEKLDELLSNV